MLNSNFIEEFCVAWRKALRRVLNLPNNTHSCLLPLLTETLPVFDEICKRSARFIVSCLFGSSRLVQSIASHSMRLLNIILFWAAMLCSVVRDMAGRWISLV